MARRPDYELSALNKDTNEKNKVGAAWVNENGTISIKLNAFIKLEASTALVLTLFPPKQQTPNDDTPF